MIEIMREKSRWEVFLILKLSRLFSDCLIPLSIASSKIYLIVSTFMIDLTQKHKNDIFSERFLDLMFMIVESNDIYESISFQL